MPRRAGDLGDGGEHPRRVMAVQRPEDRADLVVDGLGDEPVALAAHGDQLGAKIDLI